MSIVDEALDWARGTPQAGGERSYPLEEAGIPIEYIYYGVDTSQASPAEYGNYIRTSNPVYACVTQRADYLASLPLKLYKFTDTGSPLHVPRQNVLEEILDSLNGFGTRRPRPLTQNLITSLLSVRSGLDLIIKLRQLGMMEVSEGKLFELLRHVNPFWTFNRLIKMTNMSLDLWGQSYLAIERGPSGRGTPNELWWVKPTQVYPVPDPINYLKGYWYEPLGGGDWLWFEPQEMIRIYLPDPNDEFQPLSPLGAARIYADHENSSMQANMNLHKQGLHPGAIVTPTNGKIWEEGQARDIENDINKRLSGASRAHRWGVFRQEIEMHKTSVTPKDSEYIQGMIYDTERVANAYHWPIDLLAGKRTYENIDQAMKAAWQTTTLRGAFIAQELTEHLLPMFPQSEADLVFFDHTGVAVMQESETLRWERERTQVNRVITVNEWRMSRGMSPVAGGDRLFVTNQDTPLDNPVFVTGGAEEAPPPTPPANGKVNGKVPEKANA